jgi:hypothetical protein
MRPLDARAVTALLGYVAYAMTDHGSLRVTRDELIGLLKSAQQELDHVNGLRNFTAEKFLSRLLYQSTLLVEVGYERHGGREIPVYEFHHASAQEFLTAIAILQNCVPSRRQWTDLAFQVSALAGQVVKSHNFDSGNRETSVVDRWVEPLRLCVARANAHEAQEAFRAILGNDCRHSDSASRKARAVLAMSCLADGTNPGLIMARETFRTFVSLIDNLDGGIAPSSFAAKALMSFADSRWAEILTEHLIEEFSSRPVGNRSGIGSLTGHFIVRVLFAQYSHGKPDLQLVSAAAGDLSGAADNNRTIIAALTFQALSRRTDISTVPIVSAGVPDKLLRLLNASPDVAFAAALALQVISQRSLGVFLEDERIELIAAALRQVEASDTWELLASIAGRIFDARLAASLHSRLSDTNPNIRSVAHRLWPVCLTLVTCDPSDRRIH